VEFSWVLPAAEGAYKHREEIQGAWKKFTEWWSGKHLAFTGMPGVGKTVLFDHLSGKAYKRDYKPPATSLSKETGKVSPSRKSLKVTVIPGQESPSRHVAVEELFQGKHPVDGVVHVVANGFSEIRNRVAKQALIDDAKLTTLELYREDQLKQELADLASTCELIRRANRNHRKPAWMIVAVTKIDLYYDQLAQAERYYSPFGKSAFVDRMAQLAGHLGTDNFKWDAVPVCAWPEDFEWNGSTTRTALSSRARDHYLGLLAALLEDYSESS
jgi:hypothetical protein